MLNKCLFTAGAMLLACATGANADHAWPPKIDGTWQGVSNQSPVILTISTQTTGRNCNNIAGTFKDLNSNTTGNVLGYYCPSSGAFQFLRYPTSGNVPCQVYTGSLSQAHPPRGVKGILMGGVFSQYNTSYGALGPSSFSLTN